MKKYRKFSEAEFKNIVLKHIAIIQYKLNKVINNQRKEKRKITKKTNQ